MTSYRDTVRFSIAEHFGGVDHFYEKLAATCQCAGSLNIKVAAVGWDKLWNYLQEVAESDGQQDFSEVGTTWVGHFIDKYNLHRLTSSELDFLGGSRAFLRSTLQSTSLINDERMFAIPLLADTRVVYYWRDALADAGVDERDAFITPARMRNTLAALQDAGYPAWGAPTFQVNNTLHQIASWIWSNGGDFLDETGKRCTLLDSPALVGICRYYELYRYMPCNFESLDSVLDYFEDGRISSTITGPWYLMRLILGGATDEVLSNLGVALPPGPPFVGGSNLVIWDGVEDSRMDEVLSVIAHLTSPEIQQEICKATGLLPVRQDVLEEAPYATDPHYHVFAEALRMGRSLPMISFWGPLEEALLKGFGQIWDEVKLCPNCDNVEDIVVSVLDPIVRRFDRLLRLV